MRRPSASLPSRPRTDPPRLPFAAAAGWSTQIPNYNPVDIVENLRRLMKGEEMVKMLPWFRGYEVRPPATQTSPFETDPRLTPSCFLSPTAGRDHAPGGRPLPDLGPAQQA